MALRPLQSATITFGLVSIPVKFFTATKSEDVSFNLLHETCGSHVNRKWWCPKHEEIITSDELVRGFQISKGKYVRFTDEEIEALDTDRDRSLEITEFLDLDQIDPVYFEKAYFLGPAAGGAKTYKLLSSAMKKQHKVALAHWVTGHKQHLVILRPFEAGLVLHRMYFADEVRDFGAVEIESGEVKDKELKLAEMLINELTEKKFDPLKYSDEYRETLMGKIRAKSRGKDIVTDTEEAKEKGGGEVIDIMEALRRSLEGGRSPAAKRAASRKAPPARKKAVAAKKPASPKSRKRG